MSGSTPGGGAGPPPPIPRRHPSRPSLRSVSSSNTPPTPTPPLPPHDDAPEKPPVTRRPTSSIFTGDEGIKTGTVGLGYAGRVGLGSPRLEFFPRREGAVSDGAEGGGRRGSYIDDRSGLPSPPGTESDAGVGRQPLAEASKAEADIPSATKPRLRPRTPSAASSITTSGPLQRSSSSATSHTQSSRRRLQPKVPAGMTRSTSSSSSIYTLSLRDITLPGSSGGSSGMSDKSRTPSPVKRSSPAISGLHRVSHQSPSSPSQLSRHSSRHSLPMSTVPLKEPSEASRSGRKASASSKGSKGGESALSRHSSRLSLGSYSSADVEAEAEAGRAKGKAAEEAAVQEGTERPLRRSPRRSVQTETSSASETEGAVKHLRRVSAGAELDERIREAEEKIKRVNRSSRPATASMSRQSPRSSPIVTSGGGTLRRSATLSSASARSQHTPAPAELEERASWEDTEKDKSGGSTGSGKRKPMPTEFRPSGLFTPSPKYPNPISSSSRVRQLAESPEEHLSGLPSPSEHYTSPSYRRMVDSPSSRFLRHEGIEGLDRSPSSSSHTRDPASRRQWSESLSGIPSSRSDVKPLLPRDARSTISRSASVMDNTPYDDRRYQSRSSTLSSSSRFALTPGDSVSVVGPSQQDPGRKDPLDVLRRIEESREQHNKQWEEDRAASVLGDFDSSPRRSGRYERPSSGDDRSRVTPQPYGRPRPATSMSSMRDAFDREAPRSAPVHRLHQRAVADAQLESPSSSLRRATSRLSHGPPVTEPRQMRSSTSLAGRASSLDVHATSTEHGRLLLEAFRALELKLPPELLEAVPDLIRSLQATIIAQENINSSIRTSLSTANRTNVAIDLGNADINLLRRDFDTLLPLLREAGRASDQSIRELTRVILDLPKLLREGNRLSSISSSEMRGTQNQSPTVGVRRSESLLSRSSFDSARSPEVEQRRRGGSNSGSSPVSSTYGGGAARERRSLDIMRPASGMASFVSRFQRSPKKDAGAQMPLPPIDQSPPREDEARFASHRTESRARNGDLHLNSPPRRYYPDLPPPEASPQPRSPDRFRNVLKKKASSTSTHTIRGTTAGLGFTPATTAGHGGGAGSAFFPSPIRRTTTAVSQITVGDLSPPRRVKSLRSDRSASLSAEEMEMEAGSPVSRFSFQGRASSEEVQEEGDEGEAVKMLAAAAKRREGESGRWRNGWSRRTSK